MWDKPGWLNWFWPFPVRGFHPLIQKDSSTPMDGLTGYVMEGLPFLQDSSLENSADSYLCFWLALLHSVSYFFFLYRSPSSALCTVFDSISSNIDEVLSINPSANVFVFRDLTSIIKTGLPILVELIDLANSVIIYLSQTTLLRWLTFLIGSQTMILTVLLFWIAFFLLTLIFVLQWLSLQWGILMIMLSQFPLLSIIFTTRCPILLHCLWLFLCWIGQSSWSFDRCSIGGYL